ncbi:GH25 family lysozyme [Streptomyces sp. NPDC059985]|uniref:GH25 family lysozyme n=1 Tax=Streptomyces sp. NPDC059985 TaxID=3347025 RepID=UPI0036CF19D7
MGSTESLGTEGVKLSKLTSATAFGDMRSEGVSVATVRGYQSVGRVDPNLAATVANAWDAGMAHVDVYQFPNFAGGNAAGQADTLVNHLQDKDVKYGMVWLDVSGPGSYWGSSTSANAAFLADWFTAMKRNGVSVGICTSASDWEGIVGSYTGGSAYPLWYTERNGKQNFDDFTPFGGWSKPNVKTYAVAELFGVGVERTWYPN